MRFLIYTQYFPPEVGAAQTRLAATVRQLRSQGHEVEIVTAMPNYQTGRIYEGYQKKFYVLEDWEGNKVHRLWVIPGQGQGLRRMLNYMSFVVVSLWGLFKAERPDWIFVNSGPLFLSLPAYFASRRWGVPFIFNVADLWPKSIQELGVIKNRWIIKLLEQLEVWSYKKAEIVTAVTVGIKETLINEKGVPKEKVLFLPNGVDTSIFNPRSPDKEILNQYKLEGKNVFIYPGLHGYAHALGSVLDTARLLQKDNRVHFLFIGSGSEKQNLVDKAKKEKITNVTFVDPVSQETLARYLSVATAGLIHQKNTPLANETRPAKSFPIMAMGKPILFAGFGEGAELIRQNNAGVVVEAEKPEVLARAVIQMVEDPKSVHQNGANGLQFVRDQLTWEVLVKDWLDELLPLEKISCSKPLVSIIMPAYNAARYISMAIESVLTQTFSDWELVIIDDDSTDTTVKIVETFQKSDPRIRLLHRDAKGKGPSQARNTGIDHAKGRFVAFLDSDDLWVADKLEKQLNCMLRGGYEVTFGSFRRISEDGSRVGRLLPIPQSLSYNDLLHHNVIGTLTVMIDRKSISVIQMKDRGHEDFILWLELLKKGHKFHGMREDLARYRVVGGSVSANKLRAARWVWSIYRQVQKLSIVQSVWYFLNYVIRVSYKYSRF